MVSDASPGTADPKMNESLLDLAQTSFDRACAQDRYFECPDPTIIHGDTWLAKGWFLGWF